MSEDSSDSELSLGVAEGTCVAGRYVLTRRIGWGSMGEVWAATHATLGGEVAIKLVRKDADHGDGLPSTVRFQLEARLASRLSRKTRHIVSVTDHGEDGDLAYLVMELLAGESLETRLFRTGPMPLAKVVPLVYQIARALTVAHADGVIHRDLKPSNVFLTVDEHGKALVKILDFGVAKAAASSVRKLPVAWADREPDAPPQATVAGLLMGTPAYMSPEQACGLPLDARADVWALAATAYQLLAGEVPFDGESLQEVLAQVARIEPKPLAFYRPDLSDEVFDVFDLAFDPDLEMRFDTASAFASALEHAVRREADVIPVAMGSITVPPSPPPAPRPEPTTEPETIDEVVPAGVPRWSRSTYARAAARIATLAASLFGAALVLRALSGTGAGPASGSDETQAVGIVQGATAVVSSPSSPIDPPEAPSPAPVADEAKGAAKTVTASRGGPRAARPEGRALAAPETPVAAVPEVSEKRIDKSEIF